MCTLNYNSTTVHATYSCHSLFWVIVISFENIWSSSCLGSVIVQLYTPFPKFWCTYHSNRTYVMLIIYTLAVYKGAAKPLKKLCIKDVNSSWMSEAGGVLLVFELKSQLRPQNSCQMKAHIRISIY